MWKGGPGEEAPIDFIQGPDGYVYYAKLAYGRDGAGEIGVISSVTRPFCGDCTRARLSAEGKLFTCLFATGGTDLRALLRAGASDSDLRERIGGVWSARRDRYSELRTGDTPGLPRVEMSYIGG